MEFFLPGTAIFTFFGPCYAQDMSGMYAMHDRNHAIQSFISIDCGLRSERNYTDENTGINYSPDTGFVNGGVNVDVPSRSAIADFARRYQTMRSFPNGTRNCYTVGPVLAGSKYLIRAGFLYGDYDGKNRPPIFDIYFGVNLWKRIETLSDNTIIAEIIAISPSERLQVCLVNQGLGTPFISVLEVRLLPQRLYPNANGTHCFVLSGRRTNYGGAENIRYPEDPYDRLWFPSANRFGWKTLTRSGGISRFDDDPTLAPEDVLRTAIVSNEIFINATANADERVFLFMSFTELEVLSAKDVREFRVYSDGNVWSDHYRPVLMKGRFIYSTSGGSDRWYLFSINATGNSTLPPIINAHEVYGLRQLTSSPTDTKDVNEISKIKDLYKVVKNWEGDPCVPLNFSWKGVGCTINITEAPLITTLDLSRSGLQGAISSLFANLIHLTSLDLSDNNLTGEIPSELANLTRLRVLNLRNNQLTGDVPKDLYQRWKSGTLQLSIDGNTNLCENSNSCVASGSLVKKKSYIVPVIAGSLGAAFAITGLVLLACWMKKREQQTVRRVPKTPEMCMEDSGGNAASPIQEKSHDLESHGGKFSFREIVKITRNFERMIGRGGFGIVYHGSLDDGTEVAVKVILRSSQGSKEFEAEANILTRVHHKNLVSLLGYCEDQNNLALVYEYMRKGSLADILSADGETGTALNWSIRLRIALEVAQGLEYLHNFCKPCVVHRDVKSTNILLDEKLQAKLGDFGLSKAFSSDGATHISTVVAGTPGYLDPEYYQSYRLTEKSDVYSFGVVLWEIISGLPPISNESQGGKDLKWMLSRVQRGDISSIADNRLKGEYDQNSMWKAVEVAMACVSFESTSRPRMSEVALQLKECYEAVAMREISSLRSQMSNPNDVFIGDFGLSEIPSAR